MTDRGEHGRTIRIGVIGAYGFMGKNHARNLRALEESKGGVKLVAVSDVNPKVDELGHIYGIPAYTDYHEMLSGASLDAVVVAVPTTQHCQVVLDSLNADLHVMVEKPIAFSVEEARDMVRLSEIRGKNLMVGHIEWFNPAVRRLVKMIQDGELGQVLMIEAKRLNPFPTGRDAAVGIAIDLAIHDIYNVRRILQLVGTVNFGKVMAVGGSSPLTSTKFEDHVTMLLPADGVVAEVTASWLHPFKVRQTTVVGTKGTAVVDLISREIVFYPIGEGYDAHDLAAAMYNLNFIERRNPEVPDRTVEPLRLELQEFIAAVSEERKPAVTAEDACEVLEIALQASKQVLATPATPKRSDGGRGGKK